MNIKQSACKTVACFNIFPSPKIATSLVEPYNAVLTCSKMLELEDFIDYNVTFDNGKIYDVCKNPDQLDIKSPKYNNINKLIA